MSTFYYLRKPRYIYHLSALHDILSATIQIVLIGLVISVVPWLGDNITPLSKTRQWLPVFPMRFFMS